jgi:GNAT superfamily N-acetyltransferase
MSELETVTTSERHDLDDEARAAFRQNWPEFIFHDSLVSEYLERVETYFPFYDVLLLDQGAVVAGGWGVPLAWDGTVDGLPEGGYDGAMVAAVTGYEESVQPDTLCLMAAAVRSDRQGSGLAGQALMALRDRAASTGLQRVIAPVRPSLKPRYPLTPMAHFARWMREDGLHRDPWIRTHQRLGATVLGPAADSMIITGTVADWEAWTTMAFPESGQYVVPDALELVEINVERDFGRYSETNLWMQHV